MKAPPAVHVSEIRVPVHAYPVEFQPLNLELSCSVLKVVGGAGIVGARQEIMNWIDGYADINRVRLQSHGPRRGNEAIALRTTSAIANPRAGRFEASC